MIAAGLPVGAGTDATRVSCYNPWVALSWLTTGRTVGGVRHRTPDQLLDREAALRLYTEGSAWFSGEEDVKGRLAVGRLGDFAVLDRDYFAVPDAEISHVESVLTVVGGRVVHAVGTYEGLAAPLPPHNPLWSPDARFGGYQRRRYRQVPPWPTRGRRSPATSGSRTPRPPGPAVSRTACERRGDVRPPHLAPARRRAARSRRRPAVMSASVVPADVLARPVRGRAEAHTSKRHGVGFWLVALAFLTGMAFSTAPTPLYPLYQQRDGFSVFTVTVVFAVYAVGVVVSLLAAGHLSDRIGRKRVLLPALGVEAFAAVVFLVQPSLPVLLVARLVTGLGVGLITSTATAYLHELHATYRPEAGPGRFEVVSTVANIGGLGGGPLIAGVLAAFVPMPLEVPYVVFLVLLLLSMVGVAAAPATVELSGGRSGFLARGSRDPRTADGAFWRAAGGAFAAFAIFGIFTSVAPGFVAGTLHQPSRLLAGIAVFLVFGAAALAQTATSSVGPGARLAMGLGAEITGVAVLLVGMLTVSFAAFLTGGVIAGAGAGVLFKSAIGQVAASTSAESRSGALSRLFLVAYLGLIVPALATGVAVLFVPAKVALLWFAVGLAALVAVLAVTGTRAARR